MADSDAHNAYRKKPVRAQAKHASSLPCQRWPATCRKYAVGTMAIAMAGMLAMPLPAWAADWVKVAGTQYDAAATGVGTGGGTWAWDGANDLALEDYVGGNIEALGDLNVNLTGDNEVSTIWEDAIFVDEGSLVIQGDSSDGADSLTVESAYSSALATLSGSSGSGDSSITIKDATVVATASPNDEKTGVIDADGDVIITSSTVESSGTGRALGAIVSNYGDVTIDDSTVEATLDVYRYGSDDVSGAIFAWDGSVSIENGSNVTASAINRESTPIHGIYANVEASSFYEGAVVSITDSTVEASGVCEKNTAWGRGIGAFSNKAGRTPSVVINNSDVELNASGSALYAYSRDIDEAGILSITNSKIVTPAGATIRDFRVVVPQDPDFIGQMLGTGSSTITDFNSADIVKATSIEATGPTPDPGPVPPVPTPDPDPAPTPDPDPVPTPDSATTFGAGVAIPITGDDMASLMGVAGAAAAAGAVALVAAGVSLARRREQ